MAHDIREAWLNAFVGKSRPVFAAQGAPLPEKIRASVGFPSTGARSRRIGECWSDTASQDGAFEIFIHPGTESDHRIADILTHELVHAAVGLAAGHGSKFRKLAVGLGLVGPMKATTAGPDWHAWADPVLAELKAFPGAPLRQGASSSAPKVQVNRHLKLSCPDCGWHCRTSRQLAIGSLTCPACTSPAFGLD